MNKFPHAVYRILWCLMACMVMASGSDASSGDWNLVEDFQQFHDGDIYLEATDIGWDGLTMDDSEEYKMLADPHDGNNISLFLDIDHELEGWGNVFIIKALPGGGVAPGETGTLYFRYLSFGNDNFFHAGTTDKPILLDPLTGEQVEPGDFGDFNVLVRTVSDGTFEMRDGNSFIVHDPAINFREGYWYDFWIVIRNTFSGNTSTGSYTLYMQGPDDEEPVLIPVSTNPEKNSAAFRRAPLDESGNPRSIPWFMLATTSGYWENPSAGDVFLVDDIYFSDGENLSNPQYEEQEPVELIAPSSFKATIVSDSRVLLSWKDNSTSEDGHKVFMKTGDDGDWAEIAELPVEDISGYNLDDFEVGLDDRFRIQAYSGSELSDPSNVAVPTQINPIWMDVEVDEDGWIVADWFGRFSEMDPDWIYYEELGPFYTVGEDAASFWFYSELMQSWFWTNKDLYPFVYKYGSYAGWYYYYRGGYLEENWFARLSDKTFVRAKFINDALPRPATPTNLTAVRASQSRIELEWTDNSENEIGYKIFMQSGDDGEWLKIAVIPSADLSAYTVYPIDTRIRNRFRVQAYRADSESEYSNTAVIEKADNYTLHWTLLDNFQDFSDGQVFTEATDLGWNGMNAVSPNDYQYGTDDYVPGDYWMIADPENPSNIGLFLESGNQMGLRGQVFAFKALPDGGIAPGNTDTIFLRYFNFGTNNSLDFGVVDQPLQFVSNTDENFVFGMLWRNLNASIRVFNDGILQYHDHELGFADTDARIGVEPFTWYNFWLVIHNKFSAGQSLGTFTLYMQGPTDDRPVLVPVRLNPYRDAGNFHAPPVDELGNPRNILWFILASISRPDSGLGTDDTFIVDDIFYSPGENLTTPGY